MSESKTNPIVSKYHMMGDLTTKVDRDQIISHNVFVRYSIWCGVSEYQEPKPVIVTCDGEVWPNTVFVDKTRGFIFQRDAMGRGYESYHTAPIRLWRVSLWDKINRWPVNEGLSCPLSPYHQL